MDVGAMRSGLGYPTANEKCIPGQCVQSFQGGYIGWTPAAGTRIYAMTECAKLNNGRTKYSTNGANRVLLTYTGGYKQSYATNVYCVRMAGVYVADWKTDGYVGASGFKPPGVPSGPTRYLYSPTGSYSVTEAFGLGNPGTKLAYRTLNPNSRWGGNPWTPTYNKYFESSSWVGWDENMWYFATRASHDYRQGVVVNYNRPNIVQDAGFAIFLHMNKVPTAGCISLDDWAVVDYIRKSTPGDRIIMGTYNDIFR
jgi:L,D-peptidoglycan transpeptidase YkuD (ErfK/YbiS/YcfS/YnhG family)